MNNYLVNEKETATKTGNPASLLRKEEDFLSVPGRCCELFLLFCCNVNKVEH